MKKIFVLIVVILSLVLAMTACDPASTATYNLKTEADNFSLYRRVTAVNLRTDKVLFEVEGYFSYTNEADGDLSIVMEVAKDEYRRHVVHIPRADGVTFVVEQLDSSKFSAYSYKIRIFAAYPDFELGRGGVDGTGNEEVTTQPKQED